MDCWIWNSLVNPDCIELEEVLDAGEDAQHLDNFLFEGLFVMIFFSLIPFLYEFFKAHIFFTTVSNAFLAQFAPRDLHSTDPYRKLLFFDQIKKNIFNRMKFKMSSSSTERTCSSKPGFTDASHLTGLGLLVVHGPGVYSMDREHN